MQNITFCFQMWVWAISTMACLRFTEKLLWTRTCCQHIREHTPTITGCLATSSKHSLATSCRLSTRCSLHIQKHLTRNISTFTSKPVNSRVNLCHGCKCFKQFHSNTCSSAGVADIAFSKGQRSRSYSILSHQSLVQKDLDEVDALFEGILKQQRGSLARGITLIESTNPRRIEQAQVLLSRLLKHNKENGLLSSIQDAAFRIGKW